MQFNSETDLKSFGDNQLLANLENHFALERRLTRTILLHLKEVHARRLYAKRGFPNIFWMLVKHFKQSETAANQRVKALELMLAVPMVEERIVSGELNLSTLAMAQRHISQQEKITKKKLSKEEKAEIVESISAKTMTEAEIELFKLLPESASAPRTVERRVSEDGVRMSITMSNKMHANMVRLQEIWAHVDSTMDPVNVIGRAFEIALNKVDPLRRKARTEKRKTKDGEQKAHKPKNFDPHDSKAEKASNTSQSFADSAKHCVSEDAAKDKNPIKKVTIKQTFKRPNYYSKELDRQLWQRAGGRCEWIDPSTGKRCDCSFGVQREHVIPIARGGTNDLSNLQLLCRTHNLLRAREVFGDQKIDNHQKRRE